MPIFLRKDIDDNDLPILIPTDQESWEALKKLKRGQVVAVESKQARNPRHHRKLFAILGLALENQQTDFPNVEKLLDAIKIDAGHAELCKKLSGETYWSPKSIAFHNMGQAQFDEFYNKALDLICEHVIPGMDRQELEEEGR